MNAIKLDTKSNYFFQTIGRKGGTIAQSDLVREAASHAIKPDEARQILRDLVQKQGLVKMTGGVGAEMLELSDFGKTQFTPW
ncbi:MAG: hypothetical protein KGH49_03485 [Candidatus Micrarchaeota archaeon]|nr:hypothetical protein [Candidatus Micrarchaeota archaeon]